MSENYPSALNESITNVPEEIMNHLIEERWLGAWWRHDEGLEESEDKPSCFCRLQTIWYRLDNAQKALRNHLDVVEGRVNILCQSDNHHEEKFNKQRVLDVLFTAQQLAEFSIELVQDLYAVRHIGEETFMYDERVQQAVDTVRADESGETVPAVVTGPRDVIDNAANDSRFDTFWKRLNWLRDPGESDEEFAERLGVPLPDLLGWKCGKELGDMPSDIFLAISERLDVCFMWLAWGWGHKAHVLPNRKTRLTSIPRFAPWYQFTDDPNDNEPRPYFKCYGKEETSPAGEQSTERIEATDET